jgi:hypothetical protein
LLATLLLALPAPPGIAQQSTGSAVRQAEDAARKAAQADEAEAAARRRDAATRRAARQAAESGDLDALDALDDDFDLDDPLDDLDADDEYGGDDLGALDVPADGLGSAAPPENDAGWGDSSDPYAADESSTLDDADEDGGDTTVQTDLYRDDDGDDFDDNRDRPSLALDIYRSARRGLDSGDTARPYDSRDDTPGFEVPITTDDDFDYDFDYD